MLDMLKIIFNKFQATIGLKEKNMILIYLMLIVFWQNIYSQNALTNLGWPDNYLKIFLKMFTAIRQKYIGELLNLKLSRL